MIPMSETFGRVTGVDVSGEMVALAKQNLAGIENVEVLQNSGADLAGIAGESVDFCYSYAVFQHVPDKEVVWSCLREACRVLKAGGLLKCQFNGLLHARTARPFAPLKGWSIRAGAPSGLEARQQGVEADTWSGVSFCAEELAEFAARHDLQLLAMDRFDTQYLWVTARKSLPGRQAGGEATRHAEIVRVTDTFTADAAVPQSGRFASATVWALRLSEDADLNNLRVSIDGVPTAPCFIGKHVWRNPTQVNVYLPPGIRSGIVPVWLEMFGKPVSNTAPMRVIPAGLLVPRLLSVTDAVNLLSNVSIESRAIKVKLEEVDLASQEVRQSLRAEIDGRPIESINVFCLDPLPRLYEVDVFVPRDVPAGLHRLTVGIGSRRFPAVEIQVAEGFASRKL